MAAVNLSISSLHPFPRLPHFYVQRDRGHIGAWDACGVAFIGTDGCTRIEESNVLLIALNESRYKRIEGIRSLTIIACIWAGVGALLCMLLGVRSKSATPAAAATPLLSGFVTLMSQLLALVLFATLKEDALSPLALEYGNAWNCAIAACIMAVISMIPVWLLVQSSWEAVVISAARGGADWQAPGGTFLTPTGGNKGAFVSVRSP